MKLLTITVDENTLFSGEVAAVQWTDDGESVTVVGRFTKQPGFLQQLQAATAQIRQPGGAPTEPSGSVSPPALNVVRDDAD